MTTLLAGAADMSSTPQTVRPMERGRRARTALGVFDSQGGGETKYQARYRLYGKLVLTGEGHKEYLAAVSDDHDAYRDCTRPFNSRHRLRAPFNVHLVFQSCSFWRLC